MVKVRSLGVATSGGQGVGHRWVRGLDGRSTPGWTRGRGDGVDAYAVDCSSNTPPPAGDTREDRAELPTIGTGRAAGRG